MAEPAEALRHDMGTVSAGAALRSCWQALFSSMVFSICVNVLMLVGPLYMLQVYDRVLGSRSEETLVALSILMAFLYFSMALLDYARGRVLARIGAHMQLVLDRKVFKKTLRRARLAGGQNLPDPGLQDVEAIQKLFSSPALFALFDLPWTFVFTLAIFLVHPWLGVLAFAGGTGLVVVTSLNQLLTRRQLSKAGHATMLADSFAERARSGAEQVQSLGMENALFERWAKLRNTALELSISSSDRTGTFSSVTKSSRLFLQSAMLGLGAYLVLQNELSPGAMIAVSILLGRALAPIEQAIAQWPVISRAKIGWNRLAGILKEAPETKPRTVLPRPRANLNVDQVTVFPPGDPRAILRMISFRLEPGDVLGVIGSCGAGKSALAKALTGVWPVAGGNIRLDGAGIEQVGPAACDCYIGYVPQTIALFDGTIAENIARMKLSPNSDKILQAAKQAGAHDAILHLPDGYETKVGAGGGQLSGGQIQQIGIARALYSEPVLLVMDEPNSNLDNAASEALNRAIRNRKSKGCLTIIMAHRPAALSECGYILMLESGTVRAFGERDDVLRKHTVNHVQIEQAIRSAGTL